VRFPPIPIAARATAGDGGAQLDTSEPVAHLESALLMVGLKPAEALRTILQYRHPAASPFTGDHISFEGELSFQDVVVIADSSWHH
jgi:hypothetical protein